MAFWEIGKFRQHLLKKTYLYIPTTRLATALLLLLGLTYDCLQLPSVYIHMYNFQKMSCEKTSSLYCNVFFFVCIIHFLTFMNAFIFWLLWMHRLLPCLCKDGSRHEPFVWLLFYSSPWKLKISCTAFLQNFLLDG